MQEKNLIKSENNKSGSKRNVTSNKHNLVKNKDVSSCGPCGVCNRLRSPRLSSEGASMALAQAKAIGKESCAVSFMQTNYGNRFTAGVLNLAVQKKTSMYHCEPVSKSQGLNPTIQKKCSCGGNCPRCKGEEEAERISMSIMKMSKSLASSCQLSANNNEQTQISEIMSNKGSGQRLDDNIRSFMEDRFGHDFSNVRLHTDSYAARKSNELNAEAFTIGRDVFFNAGRYNPSSIDGKRLLAHELTHVVQQENSPKSTPIIFRRVASRLVKCEEGVNNAPTNPVDRLTMLDTMALGYATATEGLLLIDSVLTLTGQKNPTSILLVAYENRFGLPPARSNGFLNRLTGIVRPTQDIAIGEELKLLSKRFGIIARMFTQFIHYRCVGGADKFAGCSIPHCDNTFAWVYTGRGVIYLCPLFWQNITPQQQTIILIHEAAHINWARIVHGARGPGGNFRHAECYASLVADVFSINSPIEPCPAPPQI